MFTRPHPRNWHWFHVGLLAAWMLLAALALQADWSATPVLLTWLLINVAVLAVGERVRPFRAEWHPTAAHLKRDASLWSLALLTDALSSALIAALAIALLPGQSTWPLLWQLLIGLPLAEFGSYWLHRLSHGPNWLWRVHLLHHRPEQLNVANAITVHPLNVAYNHAARVLPLLLLGFSADAMLVIAMFGLTQSLVTHANIAGSIGPLNWLLGSAEQHRLHHSTDASEAGNFGTSLPIWDQLFGTFRTGAAPKQVGVFDPSVYPGELQTCALLAWPFRAAARFLAGRSCACCAAAG